MMTYQKALQTGKHNLLEKKISDAEFDAWYLLEFVTGMKKQDYYLRQQDEMPKTQWEQYEMLLSKRALHIPLQHLTGLQEFYGLEFVVNDKVLIPRQDTETLVEEVLQKKELIQKEGKLLDLCTGSGCILISLLTEMKKQGYEWEGTGVDLSEEALKVARENEKRLWHGKLVQWICSDLYQQVSESYDMIVSNPPYIPTKEIDTLMEEVKCFDPRMALDGKEDGLYFYREIVKGCKTYLKPKGWIFFETGNTQTEAVEEMLRTEKFEEIKTVKDLAGNPRVVMGRKL